MSAHLLRYAKKPNEVADDVESIVYVFMENILRWHPHMFSVQSTGDQDLSKLEAINNGNECFCEYVTRFFFQDFSLGGGHVGEGEDKLRHINAGRPDFDIISTRLQDLLLEMYSLLKRHYAAVKASGVLQKYFVPHLGTVVSLVEGEQCTQSPPTDPPFQS